MHTEISSANEKPTILPVCQEATLLQKKTKRCDSNLGDLGDSNSRRCDICLEYEKYSESELIECINCGGGCHKKCLEIIKGGPKSTLQSKKDKIYGKNNSLCHRCIYARNSNVDATSIR